MADYLVTGQRGAGKGVVMVSRMQLAFERGCVVATNMDIDLSELFPYWHPDFKKFPKFPVIYRLPDFPCSEDIMVAGRSCGDVKGVVTASLNERDFGELILDELQVWLNSRGWNDPRRVAFMTWLPLSRKFGWNTYFTSQTLNGLDKQARDLLEHRVHVVRTDRMGIPIPVLGRLLGWLFDKFNRKVTLPRVHMATVMYGNENPPMIVDKWNYRGTERVRNAYNTRQKYSSSYSDGIYGIGTYQLLPQHFYVDNSGAWVLDYDCETKKYGRRNRFWSDSIWCSQIEFYHNPITGILFDYPGRPDGWPRVLPYLVPSPKTYAARVYVLVRPLFLSCLLVLVVLYGGFYYGYSQIMREQLLNSNKTTAVIPLSGNRKDVSKESNGATYLYSYIVGSDGFIHRFKH